MSAFLHRLLTPAQHLRILAAVALPRCNYSNVAMPVVLVVVPYKALHPLLSFFDTVKAVTEIQAIAAVLERVEEGLRIWDVVADSRTAVREGNSVFLKQNYIGRGFYASAIV